VIDENLTNIRKLMALSADRARRNVSEISLMAVSKTFGTDSIKSAYKAGCRIFGENRVQEASKKIPLLSEFEIIWHLIGHLQKNKINKAVELFDSIDSIDDISTAEKIGRRAELLGKSIDICIEINIGKEPQKSGIMPEDVVDFAKEIYRLENINLRGLMTIPPKTDDKEQTRAYFRKMRLLFEECIASGLKMDTLSMGMSADFDIAIEEGSTMIRIGRAIFGNRACCISK